jgi:CopG family nickel-responsive transcriptional regulator
MKETIRFGVSMDEELLNEFDQYTTGKGYATRSEAIRDLIRDKLSEETIKEENNIVYGVLTYVFDHHKRELEAKITDYQHEHFESIISSSHIHIDHHSCMEIVIIKDKVKNVKTIADKLLATKGIKNGKLLFASSDKLF